MYELHAALEATVTATASVPAVAAKGRAVAAKGRTASSSSTNYAAVHCHQLVELVIITR
jgi:hypothetical protein